MWNAREALRTHRLHTLSYGPRAHAMPRTSETPQRVEIGLKRKAAAADDSAPDLAARACQRCSSKKIKVPEHFALHIDHKV